VGILRIAAEKGIPLNIPSALRRSVDQFDSSVSAGRDVGELVSVITELFAQRLNTMLRGDGFDYDLVSAVLTAPWEYPSAAGSIVRNLQDMRNAGSLLEFVLAMKRIINILPKEHRRSVGLDDGLRALEELGGSSVRSFDSDLMGEGPEKILLGKAEETARSLLGLGNGDLGGSVAILTGLVPAINTYFDSVLVNCEDEAIRKNRISFLLVLSRASGRFCNFSEIVADQ
jgi:glycyl-tRNA synthetase beta chain